MTRLLRIVYYTIYLNFSHEQMTTKIIIKKYSNNIIILTK